MTSAKASMTDLSTDRSGLLKKTLVFALFFIVESMVFAMVPLSGFMPREPLLYMQAALVAILLAVTLLVRRSEKFRPYWRVLYAFFVAGLAVLLSTLFSDSLLALFGYSVASPQGVAVAGFAQGLLRVAAILMLMWIAGAGRRSMFLQTGRIGLGFAVGFAGFVVLALLGFLPLAGQPGGLDKLLSLLPWILLFVLSNGFMEELLFRGIFLKQYETFLGKASALILTSIVFTLAHFQAGYVASTLQFLALLFPLALIWGWLMQKTDSLWGSALFHAGADCIIFFGIVASFANP